MGAMGGKSSTQCDWLQRAFRTFAGHDERWASLSGEQRHGEQSNLSSISTQSHTPSPYVSPFNRSRTPQLTSAVQMLSRSAMRMPTAANQIVARRGFSSTRMQLASPYHYPEGPRSNLPFNPMTRFFAIRYWSFMGEHSIQRTTASFSKLTSFSAAGFFLPFGVAGKSIASNIPSSVVRMLTIQTVWQTMKNQ